MLRTTSSLNCLRRSVPAAAMTVAVWAMLYAIAKVSCVSVLAPLLTELRSYLGTARVSLPISDFLTAAVGTLKASVGHPLRVSAQG